MKTLCTAVSVLGAAFALSACRLARAPDLMEGRWVGSVQVSDDLIFTQVELIRDWKGLSGTVQLDGIGDFALTRWSEFSDELAMQMKGDRGEFLLSGHVAPDVMEGTLNHEEEHLPFRLHRIAKVDRRQTADWVGTYFAESDWVRSIRDCTGVLGWNQLVAVNGQTGVRKALFPINENTFFFGSGFLIPDPVQGKVTLLKGEGGRPERILWEEFGSHPTIGERLPRPSSPCAANNVDTRCECTLRPIS